MTETLAPLIIDLLQWLDRAPRTYGDVMDAWRTSCPRLTVWEDAVDAGLVSRETRDGCTLIVPTTQGHALLARTSARTGDAARAAS